ncbi:MAG: membrane protein insertase YidC [Candidatus Omnitrophota bacterium]
MERKTIIAVGLSLLVLFGFNIMFPRKAARIPIKRTDVSEAQQAGEAAKDREKPERSGQEASREKLPPEKTTNLWTEKYTLTFSDVSGGLKALALREFLQDEKEEVLFSATDPENQLFAIRSEAYPEISEKAYSLTKENETLTYTMSIPGEIEIIKQYTIDNSSDYIALEVFVKNLAKREKPFSYQMTGPSGIEKSGQIAGRSFLEADVMIDGKIWKTRDEKGKKEKTGTDIAWAAMKNRYFAVMLKPVDPVQAAIVRNIGEKNLGIVLKSRTLQLKPGEQKSNKYLLYAGPLDEKRAESVVAGMGRVVDYGFFGGVSKVLLSVLRFFHKGVKNWGVAIILLTLLVNVILFPLTYKSFSSMQQMKKIQPHIQKLKEVHGNNSQRLNKEMMELYKKYNVNPLGGCLPMLLQMPIFIALYQGLIRSVELKGAGFLWIKDLAKPDAVALPFSLPLIGNHINILPLLMVGAMFFQQKISQGVAGAAVSDDQAKQQKTMMLLMPLLFGFLFYKMPSGLVLYWLTNTILMLGEQRFISKRINAE